MTENNQLLPDPFAEIRVLTLQSLRGINYWSRRPVTHMGLNIGAYEDISSARVPSFTDRLVTALPGLVDHHCSVGRRGGFIERLRDGTYAAHIIEHVALELQTMIGHETGFGRTRGTGVHAEYSVVFEHLHETVGLRAAALALEIVQRAFAPTLSPLADAVVADVSAAVAELSALAHTPNAPLISNRVTCGIAGSMGRVETRAALAELGIGGAADSESLVVELSPAYLLHAGLPYSHSDVAIVLDASPTDVPQRYQDPERAARLVSIVADAVSPGAVVVCASEAQLVQRVVADSGRLVHTFMSDDLDVHTAADVVIRADRAARCAADALADALAVAAAGAR